VNIKELKAMIAEGYEIVYVGKDDPYGGIAPDIFIVDEYSGDTSWHAMPVKEVKKPYYRIKERY